MIAEYFHILSDPAHTAVEFTFVLIDVIIISWVKNRIIKHIHRDIKAGKHKEVS
jgi:hypothetical protein